MTTAHRQGYHRTGSTATDRALAFQQDSTRGAIARISVGTILDGVQVDGAEVGTSATAINHLLGRQPKGWAVVDIDTAATVHRTAWDSRTLTLVASSACTVSLWVY